MPDDEGDDDDGDDGVVVGRDSSDGVAADTPILRLISDKKVDIYGVCCGSNHYTEYQSIAGALYHSPTAETRK